MNIDYKERDIQFLFELGNFLIMGVQITENLRYIFFFLVINYLLKNYKIIQMNLKGKFKRLMT